MGRVIELLVATVLIVFGILFLALNLLGLTVTLEAWWPLFIILPGLAFFVPVFVFTGYGARKALAAMAIPGSIVTVLGFILLYCSLSTHWAAWSYLWALLPAAVGLGLLVAATLGEWGRDPLVVGERLFVAGLIVAVGLGVLFELLIFGGLAERYWPVVLILIGALQLLWIFWPRQRSRWPDRQRNSRI